MPLDQATDLANRLINIPSSAVLAQSYSFSQSLDFL